jgi:hypothetical protein
MITVEELGRILHEEFDADNWGLIDPLAFDPDGDFGEGGDYEGVKEVLERAVDRLNEIVDEKRIKEQPR